MFKLKYLAVLGLFLAAVQLGFADDRTKILGIWKMVSQEWENQATGSRVPFMGTNPMGYVIYTPEGRMMTVITREGRKPPITTQDRAYLLDSLVAFTGIYRLEGDKLFTKIDVAWHPARVGSERVSFVKFDGDRLYATSDWMPATAGPPGMGRTVVTWERVK